MTDIVEIAETIAAFAFLDADTQERILDQLRNSPEGRARVIGQCVDLLADLRDPLGALGEVAHGLQALGFSPDRARVEGTRAA